MAEKPYDILRRLDDADLDPYEFRLVMHYWRVGTCWETLRTTADRCKMSLGKTKSTRDGLVKRGFIKWQDNGKGKMSIVICSPHEQIQQSDGFDCSPGEQPCSPGEQKPVVIVHQVNAILNSLDLNSQEEEVTPDPIKAIETHFTERTGLLPGRGKWDTDWETPFRLWLNGSNDVEAVKAKIDKAWEIARKKRLTIASPLSLNTTVANLAESHSAAAPDFTAIWHNIVSLMSSYGADRKPDLSPDLDALIHRAGGWASVCRMDLSLAQNKLRSMYDGA